MIPKILHYCWFGKGEKNETIQYCINTWKKYLPDYEIKEWNEENFDLDFNKYCKQAYEAKKWAFVSDYVRLYALVNEGGIYLDTDVEITNSLNEFLNEPAFIGYHSDNSIPSALMACEKNNPIFKELLKYYDDRKFILDNGELDQKTNIEIITTILIKNYNLILDNTKQNLENICIYPKEYFTEKSDKIKNYAIHHFNASWMTKDMAMNQVYTYKSNYNLTLKWINSILDNKFIFKEIKNKSIAIYGNGYLGRLLKKQADTEHVKIKMIIDNGFTGSEYEGLEVIRSQQLKDRNIDLIIVTPTYHFKEIFHDLRKIINCDIISLEKLL